MRMAVAPPQKTGHDEGDLDLAKPRVSERDSRVAWRKESASWARAQGGNMTTTQQMPFITGVRLAKPGEEPRWFRRAFGNTTDMNERALKIAELRARIANGTYSVDAEEIAFALLRKSMA
jgi:anti-sigma28 factor (negative regulator of flagellin synthesis)